MSRADLHAKHEITFNIPKPTITRKVFLERVIDWQEEGNHIQKLLHDYNNEYRKKICTKCTLEEQQKRNCVRIDMYTNKGIQITSCSHMDKARNRKYNKLIRKFMHSNPALNLT